MVEYTVYAPDGHLVCSVMGQNLDRPYDRDAELLLQQAGYQIKVDGKFLEVRC